MFFTYSQNNSHGVMHRNDAVCDFVIIEADNAEEANDIANDNGIYFNGGFWGSDCDCCGDRWHDCCDYDGTDNPSIYDYDPIDYVSALVEPGDIYCRVYNKSGIIEEFYLVGTAPNGLKINRKMKIMGDARKYTPAVEYSSNFWAATIEENTGKIPAIEFNTSTPD